MRKWEGDKRGQALRLSRTAFLFLNFSLSLLLYLSISHSLTHSLTLSLSLFTPSPHIAALKLIITSKNPDVQRKYVINQELVFEEVSESVKRNPLFSEIHHTNSLSLTALLPNLIFWKNLQLWFYCDHSFIHFLLLLSSWLLCTSCCLSLYYF